MREIKFRARHKTTGEWFYGSSLWLSFDDIKSNYELPQSAFWQQVEKGWLDPKTVGQYAGLKDKQTLTDIYEGDIMDMEGNIRGNIYESPEVYKALSTCVVAGMGYEDWENTKQRLVRQGKLIAEQSNLPQILRELG